MHHSSGGQHSEISHERSRLKILFQFSVDVYDFVKLLDSSVRKISWGLSPRCRENNLKKLSTLSSACACSAAFLILITS